MPDTMQLGGYDLIGGEPYEPSLVKDTFRRQQERARQDAELRRQAALDQHLKQYADDPGSQLWGQTQFVLNEQRAAQKKVQEEDDHVAAEHDDPGKKLWAITQHRLKQTQQPAVRAAQAEADAIESQQRQGRMSAALDRITPDNAFVRETIGGALNAAPDFISMAARLTGSGKAADELNRQSQEFGQVREQLREEDVSPYLSRMYGGAVQNIAQMAGTPGGAYSKIAGAALQAGNQALTTAEDAGLTGTARLRYAGTQALLEGGIAAVFQKMGLGGAESRMAGQAVAAQTWKQLAKNLGKDALQEIPEEVLTSVLQDVSSKLEGVTDAGFGDMVSNATDAAVQALLMSGMTNTPNAARLLFIQKPTSKAAYDAAVADGMPPIENPNRENRKALAEQMKQGQPAQAPNPQSTADLPLNPDKRGEVIQNQSSLDDEIAAKNDDPASDAMSLDEVADWLASKMELQGVPATEPLNPEQGGSNELQDEEKQRREGRQGLLTPDEPRSMNMARQQSQQWLRTNPEPSLPPPRYDGRVTPSVTPSDPGSSPGAAVEEAGTAETEIAQPENPADSLPAGPSQGRETQQPDPTSPPLTADAGSAVSPVPVRQGPSGLRANPPQVAQPTILEKSVDVLVGDETINGKGVAFPGFEDQVFVLTSPRGSKAKATKQGYTVWHAGTGAKFAESMDIVGKKTSPAEALALAADRLKAMGRAKFDEKIRQTAAQPTGPVPSSPTATAPQGDEQGPVVETPALEPWQMDRRAYNKSRQGTPVDKTTGMGRADSITADHRSAVRKAFVQGQDVPWLALEPYLDDFKREGQGQRLAERVQRDVEQGREVPESALKRYPPKTTNPAAKAPWQDRLDQIKRENGDAMVLFRMGDFYEMFGDDAKKAAKTLGLTLTTRDKSSDNPIQMAGFPYHALEGYLHKLVKSGHRVAVAEDPTGKKDAKRNITVQEPAKTPEVAAEVPAIDRREPWQMPRAEYVGAPQSAYIKRGKKSVENPEYDQWRIGSAEHRQSVREALESGKSVPKSVLADYPGLMQTPTPAPAATPQPEDARDEQTNDGSQSRPSGEAYSQGQVAAGEQGSETVKSVDHHVAVYGGKEVPVVSDKKREFMVAAQRVRDNLSTGEVGYVKTPDGKTFKITTDSKLATPVDSVPVPETARILNESGQDVQGRAQARAESGQNPAKTGQRQRGLAGLEDVAAEAESKESLALDNVANRNWLTGFGGSEFADRHQTALRRLPAKVASKLEHGNSAKAEDIGEMLRQDLPNHLRHKSTEYDQWLKDVTKDVSSLIKEQNPQRIEAPTGPKGRHEEWRVGERVKMQDEYGTIESFDVDVEDGEITAWPKVKFDNEKKSTVENFDDLGRVDPEEEDLTKRLDRRQELEDNWSDGNPADNTRGNVNAELAERVKTYFSPVDYENAGLEGKTGIDLLDSASTFAGDNKRLKLTNLSRELKALEDWYYDALPSEEDQANEPWFEESTGTPKTSDPLEVAVREASERVGSMPNTTVSEQQAVNAAITEIAERHGVNPDDVYHDVLWRPGNSGLPNEEMSEEVPEPSDLEKARDSARAALAAIGPEPHKPSNESRRFGKQGRQGADPDVVARYDAEVKAYNSWKRKYSKLKKAEVEAINNLARSQAPVPTTLSDKAAQATQEMKDAAQAFKKAIGGTTPNIGSFSPEALQAFTKLTVKVINAGALNFADYVATLSAELGDMAESLRPLMAQVWPKIAAKQGLDPSTEEAPKPEKVEASGPTLFDTGTTDTETADPPAETPSEPDNEPALDDDDRTSIKNAVVDELRAERGKPEMETAPPESQQGWLDDARKQMNDDPTMADRLVDKLHENAVNLEPVEIAALQIHQRTLTNAYRSASDKLFEAKKTGGDVDVETARNAVEALETKLQALEEATKAAGTQWGRAGVARQIELAADYSLAGVVRRAMVAKGGSELTEAERAEVTALQKEFEASKTKLEEHEKKIDELESRLRVQEQINQEKSKPKPVNESAEKKAARAKVDDAWKAFSKAVGEKFYSNPLDPEALAAAISLTKAYVELGVVSFKDFIKQAGRRMGPEKVAEFEPTLKRAWEQVKAENPDAVKPPLPKVSPDIKSSVQRAARELARWFVAEAGITDVDELVDAVHKELEPTVPGITRRQTMDAISGYGDYTELSKEQIEVQLRDLRGQMHQLGKLDDMAQGQAPSKTGQQRREPSDKERQLIQQVNEAKRRGGYTVTDPEAQLKTALDARKTYLTNRMTDLQFEIDNKQRIVRDKTASPTDPELDALRAEYDQLKAAHEAMFPKPGITDEHRLELAVAAAERNEKYWTERLEKAKKGDFTDGRVKTPPLTGPALDAIQARVDAVKQQYQELKDLANPKKTAAEREDARYRTWVKNATAKLLDRIARKDFAPPPKRPDPQRSAEALKLRFEHEQAKQKFADLFSEWQKANRHPVKKAVDFGREVLNTSRSVMTSFDLSAVARQGGWLSAGHPGMAVGAAVEMVKAGMSEKELFRIEEELAHRPNAGLYKKSKLALTGVHGKITNMEEAYMGQWAKHIPGVAHSERAYVAYLNVMRANTFDAMVATLSKGGAVTEGEAKIIANYVNVASGRGSDLGGGKLASAAAGLARVFFSPRYVLSRFQLALLQPLAAAPGQGSLRVRALVAQEYARSLTGLGLFYGLAASALTALYGLHPDDDEEKWSIDVNPFTDDKFSSDFGKVRIGDTRIDPLAGLSQTIVVMSRLAWAKKKEPSGKIVPLIGDEVQFGGATWWSTVFRFGQSKLAPAYSIAAELRTGEDYNDKKVTPVESIQRGLTPLAVKEIYDVMTKQQNVPRGVAISLLALLGFGAQSYPGRSVHDFAAAAEDAISRPEKESGRVRQKAGLRTLEQIDLTPKQKAEAASHLLGKITARASDKEQDDASRQAMALARKLGITKQQMYQELDAQTLKDQQADYKRAHPRGNPPQRVERTDSYKRRLRAIEAL